MDVERQKAIEALQARRKARGMQDPLNRLSAHINRALAEGEKPIAEMPAKES